MNSNQSHIGLNENSLGWFSSFDILKVKNFTTYISGRPPYPVIVPNPSFGTIVNGINKSDALLYFSISSIGFAYSILKGTNCKLMKTKLTLNRLFMFWANIVGLYLVFESSQKRLTGQLDNGLRWKVKDESILYDFVSDYTNNSFWKYLSVSNKQSI